MTSESTAVVSGSAGDLFTATGLYKNTVGEYWYETSYSGSTCYLYAGDTEAAEFYHDVYLTDVSAPSTLAVGERFSIQGVISTGKTVLQKARVTVSTGTETVLSAEDYASNNRYSLLNSNIDMGITFNTLAAGWYQYRIFSEERSYYSNDGTTLSYNTMDGLLWRGSFTVGSPSSSTPGKPALNNMQAQYEVGTEVAFDWNTTANTTHYSLYITKKNESGTYESYRTAHYVEPGYGLYLPVGDYAAKLQAVNSSALTEDGSTWAYTDADLVYFTVRSPMPSGTCGPDVTWTLNTDTGVLTITGTGDMLDYSTSRRPEWETYKDSITSVVIGDGVTCVGAYAFYKLSALTTVSFGKDIVAIYSYAFNNCTGLRGTLELPKNLGSIGEYAFTNCDGLTGNLVIPDNVKIIDQYAFAECDSLDGTLTIGKNVDTIGTAAFQGCSSLTGNLVIPDRVTALYPKAFVNCSGFNGSLTISEHLMAIGASAFRGCSGLTGTLVIPDCVYMIGYQAFKDCKGLTGSLIVPGNVSDIFNYAFEGTGLTDVSLPAALTRLGDGAFGHCASLTSITVAAENETYYSADGAVYTKDPVTLVAYPEGKTGEFVIPDTVTGIGNSAFYYCTKLTKVTIPQSVSSIGDLAFWGCYGLKDVEFLGDAPTVGQDSFFSINATAWYPADNATYTDEVKAAYGSSLTWAARQSEPDTVAVTGVTVAPTALTLTEGETAALAATVSPADASNKTVSWSSSAPAVVRVENGTVTAVSAGTATITVTTEDGGFTAACAVTVNPAVGEDQPTVSVARAKGRPGGTVDVTISLANNPGIISMILEVGYDAGAMTLTGVTDAGILGNAMHTDNLTLNPYQLTWNNGTAAADFTAEGKLVTLTFQLAEDAEEKDYPITLACSGTMNYELDDVAFTAVGSVVTVSKVTPGDVNGDGTVNIKDSIILQRYVAKWSGYGETAVDLLAADVNSDGTVNIKDSIILQRYVAKWSGYETLPYEA